MFINFERGHNSLASLFLVKPRKFAEEVLRENGQHITGKQPGLFAVN